jgi:AraC-like DNA-binding protein
MSDTLSILLESLKVQSASLADFRFIAPWGFEIAYPVPHSFTVVEGRCWYDFGSRGAGYLEAGDSLLVSHGPPYVLSHARGLPQRRWTDLWLGNGLYRFDGAQGAPGPLQVETVGDGPATRLFSFAFALRGRARHPLMTGLPEPLIVRRADNTAWPFVSAALAFIQREAHADRIGYVESARQLAELFITQWVRTAVRRQHGAADQGLRGLDDPVVGRALHALHSQPEETWSLDRLAKVAGLSRSAFAQRFTERVGLPPMRYLSRWRILRATELLAQQAPVAEVAAQLGYASERTFREAFKRETGRPPSAGRAKPP